MDGKLFATIALVVSAGAFAFALHGGPQGPQGVPGSQGVQGERGLQGSQGVAGKDGVTKFGGASSPNVINGCVEIGAGGASLCVLKQNMIQASTTCSFRPGLTLGASSTLIRANAGFTNTAGTALGVEFGKAPAVMATTTSLGYDSNVSGNMTSQASTTLVSQRNDATVFGLGDYLNVKIGSSTVSSLFRGTCTALFLSF